VSEVALPGDDDPDTAHFCALDSSDRVVGTGSVRPEAPPWEPASGPAWRLRGMATEPDVRGSGIGTAVLTAVIDHVAGLGGGLLWCHARTPAVEFYRRAGLVTRGEAWLDPAIGPHIVMWREVEARPAAR
jgi:GNAT superfamily N-acetyltransferase